MNLMFTPERIDLNNFEMLTGSSDLKAKGTLQNFIPFMISNKTLVGDFQFWSKDFTATDFMEEERDDSDSVAQGMTSEVETAMKIPDFIEFNSYFIADKVHYGNIDLDNAKGTLEVKDQKATLSNLSADFFGGTIGGTANLSTENDISNFEMNFDLDKVNIIDSFTNVEMLRKLAPISGAMNGLFSSELVVSGNTDQYMMPELSSLSGKASINILEATMYPPNSLTLRHINRQLKFIDWSSLKLKDLATSLKFNKGKIEVTPFELIIDDEIILNVKGAHYLDQHIDYDLDFDLPVKYLTNSYSNLLPDLSVDTASKNIHVTLPVKLREMFTSPMINIQIGAALNDFKKQLAQRETENVKKKIKSKVTKVLNQSPIASSKKVIIEELISPSKDSNNENTPKQLLQHKKQQVKSQAKKLLNGIFVK